MRFRVAVILVVALLGWSGQIGASTPRWFQPIVELSAPAIHEFQCIISHESRSTFAHPNLGDNNRYGSSGIFQIEQSTWQAHQLSAHVPLSIHVWQATPYEQSLVAVAVYKADGFVPWRSDGCV